MPDRKSRHAKEVSAQSLNVRSFQPEDAEDVRRICYSHFRSLCFPAVQYYCIEHFRDLIVLLIIGKFFQSWRDLALATFLFLLYLFARARIELELYIYRDCPDLADIQGYYLRSDPEARSHFWVAEQHEETSSNGVSNSQSTSGVRVVGCVGCCPTRDDPSVVQLLRLVVAEDARRMRNGSRLLAQFENFAIQKGYREVRLYTNNLSTSHMKFIRQHGYDIVQWVSRTLMRGSLIQWKKVLLPKTLPVGSPVSRPVSELIGAPDASTRSTPSEPRPRPQTNVVMD